MTEGKVKTEKELKKEAEKAAKLAKFEEKQRKLAEKAAAAKEKPKEEKKDVAKKKEILEYTAATKLGDKKGNINYNLFIRCWIFNVLMVIFRY